MCTDPYAHATSRPQLSRRRLFALPAALAAPSACSGDPDFPEPPRVVAAPADGVLAANFNEHLDVLSFGQLQHVGATWVRGFYPLQRADHTDPAGSPELTKILTAAAAGYGTVLSLKFGYRRGLPRAGSSAMNLVLQRVDKVLAATMGKVSVVVVGNEPFIECSPADRRSGTVNTFYERMARHVLDYRSRVCGATCSSEIYLGALTGLNDPAGRNLQTGRWLEFVKNTPELAGTDCHPHVSFLAEGQQYLDYIIPRIGPHQKFLATEFSLVKLFRSHMNDPVPAAFANRWHVPRTTPVWQVLRGFIEQPVSQRKWMDFLTSCPWFASNRTFLTDMVGRFRQTGRCAVVAYGIIQDAAMSDDFGPDSKPWILNSVFCPRTVKPGADGLPGRNTVWSQQFRAAQDR